MQNSELQITKTLRLFRDWLNFEDNPTLNWGLEQGLDKFCDSEILYSVQKFQICCANVGSLMSN